MALFATNANLVFPVEHFLDEIFADEVCVLARENLHAMKFFLETLESIVGDL